MAHAKKVEQWIRASDELAKVKLMTLHRSKGLEFDRVCIIGLHAMVIPHHRSLQVPENRKNAAWEEERRLLYVGLTRARNELYLSVSKTRQGKRVGASPFLKEMGAPIHRKEIVSSVSPSARDGVRPFSLKRRYTQAQPQLRFASEQVTPGMKIVHNKFGEGLVLEVTPLDGVAPGRKILVRFGGELQILHYELSRQLGLITLP
jgi:DNA helicase-2/ATP-dependent DNA helicase PcrA